LATVITNLLSAIPIFGQDIVELKNFTENYTLMSNILLPTIGIVSPNALKKGKKEIRLDKKEYLSIPSSFLAFLAGIIDGDGYIQITKTTKGFIAIKLVIQIHLEDISTLEYIQSVLKLGKLTINRDHKSSNCKLIINRTDLQEVIFPLFLHHGISFLTLPRYNQFNLAMFIFKEDIKFYDAIVPYLNKIDKENRIEKIPSIFNLPITALDYTNLPFFKNWIVGFTNPNQFEGVINFVKENPLKYKRVKLELKKKFSNRDSYYYLLKILKNKEKEIKTRSYSTYSISVLQNKIAPIQKLSLLRKDKLFSNISNVKGNEIKDIVIWGSNLNSTIGYGRFTKLLKSMIKLPSYQEDVLIGIMLSDGHLWSSKTHEYPRFDFKQSLKNSFYVWFVFLIFSHYCNKLPYSIKDFRKGKINWGIRFYTRGLPCFNEYRKLFYINKVKIIPYDIYNLLSPVALAHLIMGDGTARKFGLILCVESYGIYNVVRLLNVLMIKYNLDCTLHYPKPDHPRIYIRNHSMPILRELVKPFMIDSMLYKIGL